MINSLIINNFQSHHNTIIEFHEGLNIIVGQSNSGKSAILRALRLIIENKPSGDSFITKGQKECSLDILVNERHISRIKGKDNLYGLDGQCYKAFGQEVPEEIKQIINFNDINIQKQLDSPFLLSQTSGEIAKFFNKVFNLEKIDSSQQQVKSKLSDTKKRMTILEEDLKEDTKKLKSFDWIDRAEKSINILSEQMKAHTEQIGQSERLLEIIKDYERIYDSYIAFDDFEDMKQRSWELFNRIDIIKEIKWEWADLYSITENINRELEKLKKEKAELQKLEKQLHDIMPSRCPLCNQEIKK